MAGTLSPVEPPRVLGHSAHQSFVVVPAGLLIGSVIFDWLPTLGLGASWYTVAKGCLSAGIVTGILAAPVGFLDWLRIPTQTRARRVRVVHGIANVMMLALFTASWYMRQPSKENASVSVRLLSVAALAVSVSLLGAAESWCRDSALAYSMMLVSTHQVRSPRVGSRAFKTPKTCHSRCGRYYAYDPQSHVETGHDPRTALPMWVR